MTVTPANAGVEELPPLREVIARHGLSARRKLGQHFLLDSNLTDRIARSAGNITNGTTLEIGPGPGGLTRSLLKHGASRIVAVEKDPRCIEALRELQSIFPDRLVLLEEDALEIKISDIANGSCRIVSNLPYNISTVLLIGWLQQSNMIERMTLMFQKEVADRLTADVSTKSYGRLSVMTQWLCDIQFEFNVDRQAFTPPPKVASSVVSLTPRQMPAAEATWSDLERVTALAFNQRRKMLRSSLKDLNVDFDDLGIDPTLRAENLSVEQFCALSRQ